MKEKESLRKDVSEKHAWALDRLSILILKIYHMKEKQKM